MDCKGIRGNHGFTLIEILITVVVLSTGIVLVLQALHDVLHIWTVASARTQSAMYSQELFMQFHHQLLDHGIPTRISGPFRVEPYGGVDGLYRVHIESDSMEDAAVASERSMLFYAQPPDMDKGQ